MTRRPSHKDGGAAGSGMPDEHADIAARLSGYLSAHSLDPAVRARHLHHLRELAAVQLLSSTARGHVGLRWRGLGRRVAGTAAASLATVTLSASAVAAASLNAVPGDPLYGTKRLVEQVQLAAAMTTSGDVAVLLGQAQHRLDEMDALIERGGDPELLERTIVAMQHKLAAAGEIASKDDTLQEQVAETATVATVRLGEMIAGPLPEQAEFRAQEARQIAREHMVTGSDSDTLVPPGGRTTTVSPSSGEPEDTLPTDETSVGETEAPAPGTDESSSPPAAEESTEGGAPAPEGSGQPPEGGAAVDSIPSGPASESVLYPAVPLPSAPASWKPPAIDLPLPPHTQLPTAIPSADSVYGIGQPSKIETPGPHPSVESP